jgi:DNA-binding beta-propeller fold protein YncE
MATVVVANADALAPNLSEFRLRRDGQLVQSTSATAALPAGSQPGDVLFNRLGTKLVATLVASSQIASFTVGGSGVLTPAPGSPYGAQGFGPFGSEFSPINPDQLLVSNAHNGAGLGTVSAFDDGQNGSLSSIGSSPFAEDQTAPCWVTISPDGRYLYAVNAGSGTISSDTIARDGAHTLESSTTVSDQAGVGAGDPGLTPNGTVLYVNESRVGAVGEFAVHGGTLTELPGSPATLPAGAHPVGIAVR